MPLNIIIDAIEHTAKIEGNNPFTGQGSVDCRANDKFRAILLS
jgi:hypothetical protein